MPNTLWLIDVRGIQGGSCDRTGRLFHPIQREIEDIVVVKRSGFCPPLVLRIDRSRQQERDFLLAETAMRAKAMPGQLAEIVILMRRADNCLAVNEDCEIPFPVDGKFELLARLLLIQDQFDAGQRSRKRHHGLDITSLSQMHPDEGPQGTVMPNEGIGDRTNDANGSGTETRVQFVLEIYNVGGAVPCRLVVHPMVGSD